MKLNFYLPLLGCACLLMLSSCTGNTSSEASNSEPNDLLSGIKVKDLDNNKIDLTEYKGKTLVINFWATWCAPCIKEMPSLEAAKQLLKDEDIQFLLISNEPQNQIKKFVKKHDYTLKFARLDMPIEQLNIAGLPTTFIITPEGELAHSEAGIKDWASAESIKLIKSHN